MKLLSSNLRRRGIKFSAVDVENFRQDLSSSWKEKYSAMSGL